MNWIHKSDLPGCFAATAAISREGKDSTFYFFYFFTLSLLTTILK